VSATRQRRRSPRGRSDAPHQLKRRVALSRALVVLLALLAANVSAQTRVGAAGESLSSGAITGRVTGEDGQPLSNVRVFASRAGVAPGFATGAVSDDEGKFALRNLASGAYLVNAFAPNYLLEPDPLDQPSGRVYHRVGDSLSLRMIKGGVITGTVTDANGEPVIGLFVDAMRVRGADGRALREGSSGRLSQPRQTDDRGVYRIYGLRAGTYIVRAGGKGSFGPATPYDLNAPTYYPATTREAATGVQVQAGQEMSGIDIRYRGEAGHTLSGTVSGALPPNFAASGGITVALKHVSAAAPELLLPLQPDNSGFAFDGIADGDYDLLARPNSPRDEFAAASPPRRVRLRGTDINGITLTLSPLASVSGQLLFDPPAASGGKITCPPAPAPRAEEFVIALTRLDETRAAEQSSNFFTAANETAPDDKGGFHSRALWGGRYQLLVRPPAADFYVRAVTLANTPTQIATAPPNAPAKLAPAARTASPPTQSAGDAARGELNLQAGQRLAGLNVYVAAGASSLRGRVVASTETATGGASPDAVSAGAPSASRPLRVHLVPSEREQADNVWRYAESAVAPDGTFAFTNLSPGRYWLLTRPAPDTADMPPRPLAHDSDARSRLRREAEASNVPLDLAPCQRLSDFVLRRAAK
jgi:Carboxypeptidase regulatory-like domain